MNFDPISSDPIINDPAHLPTMHSIAFHSGGSRLLGILYTAAGIGPHPTLLLLHGIPGDERNFDLAQIIRRAGWNVMMFHYRGSWGSEGDYTFQHVLDDTNAALDYLKQEAAKHKIDVKRIALAGHSLGGWSALITTATRKDVIGAASIAGFNLGMAGEMMDEEAIIRKDTTAFLDECAARLNGTSGVALADEAITNAQAWDYTRGAANLVDCPIMLVAGKLDTGAVPELHHTPMVRALEKAGAAHLRATILDADHDFGSKRLELARLLVDWLNSL